MGSPQCRASGALGLPASLRDTNSTTQRVLHRAPGAASGAPSWDDALGRKLIDGGGDIAEPLGVVDAIPADQPDALTIPDAGMRQLSFFSS